MKNIKYSLLFILFSTKSIFTAAYEPAEDAFYEACENGQTETVLRLLQENADPNKEDIFGMTPLCYTCIGEHKETAQILIQNGAQINNIEATLGNTALHEASKTGNIEIIHLLLSHNANINATNYNGWTPLFEATLSEKTEAVLMLLQHDANKNIQEKVNNKTASDFARERGYQDIVIILEDYPVLPLRLLTLLFIKKAKIEIPEWFPPLLLQFEHF